MFSFFSLLIWSYTIRSYILELIVIGFYKSLIQLIFFFHKIFNDLSKLQTTLLAVIFHLFQASFILCQNNPQFLIIIIGLNICNNRVSDHLSILSESQSTESLL